MLEPILSARYETFYGTIYELIAINGNVGTFKSVRGGLLDLPLDEALDDSLTYCYKSKKDVPQIKLLGV